MSDPLLERAKLLVMAANFTVGDSNSPSASPTPKKQSSPSKQSSSSSGAQSSADAPASRPGEYHGAAIPGSSLLTTFSDIRTFCQRGGTVMVDGIACTIKETGEWSANCIELANDFSGDLNLNALITLPKFNEIKAKISKPKSTIQPVPSANILKAIESLSEVDEFSRKLQIRANENEAGKTGGNNRESKLKKPKKVNYNYDNNDSYNTIVSSNDNTEYPPVSYYHVERPRGGGGSGSNYENGLTADKMVLDLKKTQDRIADWKKKMETKIMEDRIEEEQQGRRFKRHQERIQAIRKESDGHSIDYGAVPLIVQPKRNNPSRIKKAPCKIDEEAEREEKLKQEELKAVANELKVAKLREKTQQRVLEYKEKLAREEIDAKQRQEAEEMQRKLSELQAQSDSRKIRLHELKRETALRLRQQNEQTYLKRQEEQALAEKKLQDLARLRGRQDPTSRWINGQADANLPPPVTYVFGGGDFDGYDDEDDADGGRARQLPVPPAVSGCQALPPLRSKSEQSNRNETTNESQHDYLVNGKHRSHSKQIVPRETSKLAGDLLLPSINLKAAPGSKNLNNDNSNSNSNSNTDPNNRYDNSNSQKTKSILEKGNKKEIRQQQQQQQHVGGDSDDWSDDSLSGGDNDIPANDWDDELDRRRGGPFYDQEDVNFQVVYHPSPRKKAANNNIRQPTLSSLVSSRSHSDAQSTMFTMDSASSVVSDVTPENSPVRSMRSNRGDDVNRSRMNAADEVAVKKKKKKNAKPVWKMEPIPIKPYIPVPTV